MQRPRPPGKRGKPQEAKRLPRKEWRSIHVAPGSQGPGAVRGYCKCRGSKGHTEHTEHCKGSANGNMLWNRILFSVKMCYICLCCRIFVLLCKGVLHLFMLHSFNYVKMCFCSPCLLKAPDRTNKKLTSEKLGRGGLGRAGKQREKGAGQPTSHRGSRKAG